MSKAKANNIEIEYETFGEPSAKPLLLVHGLGAQMTGWEKEFCQSLVDRDFFVIRFDNRDIGLSTKFEVVGEPEISEMMTAFQMGQPLEGPYSLEDMADDAIGLLDTLNIEKAHICGVSMGGMIVQIIAYRHPSRVLSLTSIMSTTGNPFLPQGNQEALEILLTLAPKEFNAYIDYKIKADRMLHGSGFPFDEEKQVKLAAETYNRSSYPLGKSHQLLAILSNGDRTPNLSLIKIPTLVIHGDYDPIFPIAHATATAQAISGSELLIIEGMGHSLPPETWGQISDAIAANRAKT